MIDKDAARRRRETPRALAGVDVDACVAHLRSVPVLSTLLGRKRVRVDVGHLSRGDFSGRAWTRQSRIRVSSTGEVSRETIAELVLHELVHVALPDNVIHGERFRRVLVRAAEQAWGVSVEYDAVPKVYDLDTLIVRALEASGAIVDLYPVTVEPKPTRAQRMDELVEKRAAHAMRMLARAERRLKLARTLHRKWMKRVGYYERTAAKRGTR